MFHKSLLKRYTIAIGQFLLALFKNMAIYVNGDLYQGGEDYLPLRFASRFCHFGIDSSCFALIRSPIPSISRANEW